MCSVSHVTKQNVHLDDMHKFKDLFIRFTKNDMGNSLGPIHFFFFFFNNVLGTVYFNSVDKMSHNFGLKLKIVSEPYTTIFILLACSAVLFLRV